MNERDGWKRRNKKPTRGNRKKETYKVGYGKPPRDTQFKLGQSGNSKGRPRNRPNMNDAIRKVLGSKVQVTIRGKPRDITRFEAMLWKQSEEANKGNTRAAAWLAQLIDNSAPELKFDHSIDIKKLSEEQLADFIQRVETYDQDGNA